MPQRKTERRIKNFHDMQEGRNGVGSGLVIGRVGHYYGTVICLEMEASAHEVQREFFERHLHPKIQW